MMLDATKGDTQKHLLETELNAVGIRLNQEPPKIYFKIKSGGGVSINSTVPLTQVDEKLCKSILHEYKIHNAEVLFKEDATIDQFIDVIEKNNRSYISCLYVYNKIDQITIQDVNYLAHLPHSVVVRYLNISFLLNHLKKDKKFNLSFFNIFILI